MTKLPILINYKGESYNYILVIIDWLIKLVHYELIKVTINTLELAKVILDMGIQYHDMADLIITNKNSLYITKFWSLICYFFDIKQRLLTAFHFQIEGQTKQQNSTIKAYLRAFINFQKNDQAILLLMADYVYNNAKNTNIDHILFELNCSYYPYLSYKKDIDLYFKFKSVDKLSVEL